MKKMVSFLFVLLFLNTGCDYGKSHENLKNEFYSGPEMNEYSGLQEITVTDIKEVDSTGLVWISFENDKGRFYSTVTGPNHGLKIGDVVTSSTFTFRNSLLGLVELYSLGTTEN